MTNDALREREAVVEFLHGAAECWDASCTPGLRSAANMIQRGDHLKDEAP